MSDFLAKIAVRRHRIRMPFLVLVLFAMICGACSDYPSDWDKKEHDACIKKAKEQVEELREECNSLSKKLDDLQRKRKGAQAQLENERKFLGILREQIGAEKVAEYQSICLEMEKIREIRRVAMAACPAEEAGKSNSAWTKLDVRLQGVEKEFDTLDRTLRTIVSHVEMEGN